MDLKGFDFGVMFGSDVWEYLGTIHMSRNNDVWKMGICIWLCCRDATW